MLEKEHECGRNALSEFNLMLNCGSQNPKLAVNRGVMDLPS